MATITKADLADRVLENLGVKPAGQAASQEDTELVEEAINSAHARLKKEGLSPYPLTAIPEWAQIPLRDFVSADMVGSFGITGEKLQLVLAARPVAERQLGKQTAVGPQQVPTKFYNY